MHANHDFFRWGTVSLTAPTLPGLNPAICAPSWDMMGETAPTVSCRSQFRGVGVVIRIGLLPAPAWFAAPSTLWWSQKIPAQPTNLVLYSHMHRATRLPRRKYNKEAYVKLPVDTYHLQGYASAAAGLATSHGTVCWGATRAGRPPLCAIAVGHPLVPALARGITSGQCA